MTAARMTQSSISRLVIGSVSRMRKKTLSPVLIIFEPAKLIGSHQPNSKGGAQNDRVLFARYFRIQKLARAGEIGIQIR